MCKINYDNLYMFVAVTVGLISGLLIVIVVSGFFHNEPQGIGGFVYQEIEWAEQTYNVMKENCDGGIFYFETKQQLGCLKNICKDDGYCKTETIYFPVIIRK